MTGQTATSGPGLQLSRSRTQEGFFSTVWASVTVESPPASIQSVYKSDVRQLASLTPTRVSENIALFSTKSSGVITDRGGERKRVYLKQKGFYKVPEQGVYRIVLQNAQRCCKESIKGIVQHSRTYPYLPSSESQMKRSIPLQYMFAKYDATDSGQVAQLSIKPEKQSGSV